MRSLRHVRPWLRERPTVADAILAGLVFLVATTLRPGSADSPFPVLTGWSLVLMGLSCLALVLRRRWPVAVWVVAGGLGVIGITVGDGPSQMVVPVLVSLYTVAAYTSSRAAAVAVLVTALAFGAAFWDATNDEWLTARAYALLTWGGMAAAIGVAVRSQRAVLAAAEERAQIAEQSGEEVAQRRVTQERMRIARELHDVVAHHIAVINVQAGVARHLLDSQPEKAAEALGHVRDSSQVVLSEMASLLGLLRTTEDPAVTQPAPGLPQVEELVDSMRRAGLDVTWTVSGQSAALAPGAELAAYRLVQESLTNAHKYGLGRADLAIRYEPTSVTIDVTNPAPAARESDNRGHGLVGMRERVAAAGGVLDVGRRADQTFAVHASLPAEASAHGPEPADRQTSGPVS